MKRKQTDFAKAEEIGKNYKQFIAEWSDLPLFSSTPEIYKEKYYEISKQQNPRCMAASLRGFGAGVMPVLCEQLKNMKMPIVYLAGEADSKYVQNMKNMHERTRHSEFVIARKSGHRVHTDQPGDVLQALSSLRRLSADDITF